MTKPRDLATLGGGFTQSGTGAIQRTVENKLKDTVSVKDFGAVGDGTTNDTAAIQAAITATPANGTLVFPPGTYRGYILLRRSDICISGSGTKSTTLKLPNSTASITVPKEGGGTSTGLPNVIEIGECALGNSANTYENVTIKDITIDGNYSNNTAPTLDVFGHGIIATKTSNLVINNVVAKDCYVTGIDVVINSNYAKVDARVETCGNADMPVLGRYPNFDINSSKFSQFRIISSGGYYAGRMLDNCWGNQINFTAYNPSITGFIYNNQTANQSYSNTINVSVIDGCAAGQGVSIGNNCHSSNINAVVRNVAGTGVYVAGASEAYAPRGNILTTSTYGCGGMSLYAGGLHNQHYVTSKLDGDSGAAGSHFAVEIIGKWNQFVINVEDSSTPQVRGVVIRAGAQRNNILDFKRNTLVEDFLLQDTSNTNIWYYRYSTTPAPDYWTEVTLNAGWSNTYGAPYTTVQYLKDSFGEVSIKGVTTGGTGVIFTLPAGYRPPTSMTFPTSANGAMGVLRVNAAGQVELLSGTATTVDLSPIRFTIF